MIFFPYFVIFLQVMLNINYFYSIPNYNTQQIAIQSPIIQQQRSTFPFWPQISINTTVNPVFSPSSVYPNGQYYQPSLLGIGSPMTLTPRLQSPASTISSPTVNRSSFYQMGSGTSNLSDSSFSSNPQVNIIIIYHSINIDQFEDIWRRFLFLFANK